MVLVGLETRVSEKRLSQSPTIHPSATVLNSQLGKWTEVGERSKIADTFFGDYSYAVNDCDIIYADIGKFVNIAAHVRINPGQHPMHRASQHHFQYRSAAYGMADDDPDFFDWRRASPVKISHDVWVGHGAIIKGGISVGTGAVIGAGAIVTKDVKPYSIVTGVPAKQLRLRFTVDVQDSLLQIAWWDWSHQDLTDRLDDFRNLNVQDFCRKYNPGTLVADAVD